MEGLPPEFPFLKVLRICPIIIHKLTGDNLITCSRSREFWACLFRLALFPRDREQGLVIFPHPVGKFCLQKHIPDFEFVVSSNVIDFEKALTVAFRVVANGYVDHESLFYGVRDA